MRVTLESTSRIVDVEAPGGTVRGRVWEGTTEDGIPVFAVITRIAVRAHLDQSRFEAELERQPDSLPSSESHLAIPSRLVL